MVAHFGVDITVECAFVDDAFRLDSGVLDTDVLHPNWVWTDISSYVKGISTNIGRQRGLERFAAGTATLTLEDTADRRFDPTNTVGAYYPNVVPGKPIRIRATHNAITYDIWWGFVDKWDPDYIKGPAGGGGTKVEVFATDAFKLLANNKPVPVPVQGSGELSGQRINRILSHADWPGTMRDVDAGSVPLIGTSLSDSALDELMVTMFSEGGSVYQNQSGEIVFEDRNAIFTNTNSLTSQATFGDSGAEIRYFDIQGAYDDELVKNDVVLTTRPGKTVRRQNSESQSGPSGVRSYEVSGLVNQNVGDLQGLADFLIAVNTEAELRFDSITLRPQRAASTMWPQVLGRLIHDRITILRRPSGGGAPIELDVFIEGIAHKAEATGAWETTFFLSAASADIFFDTPFILDTSVLDGTAVIGF